MAQRTCSLANFKWSIDNFFFVALSIPQKDKNVFIAQFMAVDLPDHLR